MSGTRVVAPGKSQAVAGIPFQNYGSHSNEYPSAYFTAAAALGTTRADVDEFVARLHKCFGEFAKRCEHGGRRGSGSSKGSGRGRGSGGWGGRG